MKYNCGNIIKKIARTLAFASSILCFSFTFVIAQKGQTKVCGEYLYVLPDNVSKEDGIKKAIQQARLDAIASEYNTELWQVNHTRITNRNEKSNIDFVSYSGSELKGEWIGDIKIDTIVKYEKGILAIKAKVCGYAREITRKTTDLMVKILRNGTTGKYESDVFVNNDDFYLLFQSPESGFVVIYLVDEESDIAYCLLPYSSSPLGQYVIEKDREYIFFSNRNKSEGEFPDEMTLTCSKSIEYNTLYVIFSPNTFTKATDSKKNELIPRELSYGELNNWLLQNRIADSDMVVIKKNIEIRKNY